MEHTNNNTFPRKCECDDDIVACGNCQQQFDYCECEQICSICYHSSHFHNLCDIEFSSQLEFDLQQIIIAFYKGKNDIWNEEIQFKCKINEFKSLVIQKYNIENRLKEIRLRIDEIEEDFRNIPVWRKSALTKKWGDDLGGSDETILTMQFDRPVMVWGYPSGIKAFYMKRDPDNDNIALGVDVLAPEGYGEIIGGGQREDSLELLLQRIKEHNLPEDAFKWYLDLRKYGSVPHSGFGLGLERTVAWICGLKHVRETIPFPRMLGRLYP